MQCCSNQKNSSQAWVRTNIPKYSLLTLQNFQGWSEVCQGTVSVLSLASKLNQHWLSANTLGQTVGFLNKNSRPQAIINHRPPKCLYKRVCLRFFLPNIDAWTKFFGICEKNPFILQCVIGNSITTAIFHLLHSAKQPY